MNSVNGNLNATNVAVTSIQNQSTFVVVFWDWKKKKD